MTILKVRHITHYTYHQPVGFGAHRILFRPRDSYDQRLLQSSLAVLPEPSDLHWIHDVFGNCVAVAQFRTMSTQLRFETSIVLDHTRLMPLEFRGEAGAAESARSTPVARPAAPGVVGGFVEVAGAAEASGDATGDALPKAMAGLLRNPNGPTVNQRAKHIPKSIRQDMTTERRE